MQDHGSQRAVTFSCCMQMNLVALTRHTVDIWNMFLHVGVAFLVYISGGEEYGYESNECRKVWHVYRGRG